jgi:DNA-binding YbaB/EbfC family protein
MKLPKGFGGQGFQGVLANMQTAMARAQALEEELASERFVVDKGVVKAVFDGRGELVQIKLDASVVDPEDIESLEDLVVSTVRDGFNQATERRDAKVREIMPQVPGM